MGVFATRPPVSVLHLSKVKSQKDGIDRLRTG